MMTETERSSVLRKRRKEKAVFYLKLNELCVIVVVDVDADDDNDSGFGDTHDTERPITSLVC